MTDPLSANTESPLALLALEDGTLFRGRCVGAPGEAFGELVFNTGMTGYQEVLTDPSYRGQIVVMTYPEVGIYGVNPGDVESGRIQVAGFVVHRAVRAPFNQRATASLPDYLRQAGLVVMEGVDTRALTRLIRTRGAMRGAISTSDLDAESLLRRVRQSPPMEGRNLALEVSTDEKRVREPPARLALPNGPFHVVVVDVGTKEGIVRELFLRRARVTVVPYDAGAEEVLSLHPHGVIVSNGPGDPAPLAQTIRLTRALLERGVPLAGICQGHHVLGLALGGKTYKMRFGHRGVNHPVKDLRNGRVLITTQNHGFAVDPTSLGIAWAPLDTAYHPTRPEMLPESADRGDANTTMAERLPDSSLLGTSPLGFGPVEITHLSLNDGTVEGLALRQRPAFSVQFHPEASPGPHDANPFFERFFETMEETGTEKE